MSATKSKYGAATIAEHQADNWAKELDPRDPKTTMERAHAAHVILTWGIHVDLAEACREAAEKRWGRREFPPDGNQSVTARDYGHAVELAQKALAEARRESAGVAPQPDPLIPADFSAPAKSVIDYAGRAYKRDSPEPKNGLEASAAHVNETYAPLTGETPAENAAPFDLRGIAWLNLQTNKTGRCNGMKLSKTGLRLPMEFRMRPNWLRAAISKGGGFKDGVLVLQFQDAPAKSDWSDWIKRQSHDTIWNSRALAEEPMKNGWTPGVTYRLEERPNCWLVTKEAI